MQLNEENLTNVPHKELGKKTTYDAKRISMAETGDALNLDQRNAIIEVIGPVNFERFATVRFALDGSETRASLKQGFSKI